jgi:tetrahydromethanopterin S-methyltransferase subunit E
MTAKHRWSIHLALAAVATVFAGSMAILIHGTDAGSDTDPSQVQPASGMVQPHTPVQTVTTSTPVSTIASTSLTSAVQLVNTNH